MNPYENLVNAIILQAAKDYRVATMWLVAHRPFYEEDEMTDDYISTLADKQSIEQFFLSDWFCMLTNLDGKALLEKLKSEVA